MSEPQTENPMIKPDRSDRITDYELNEGIRETIGVKIYCIQLEKDLWRVYLTCRDSRSKLLVEGFEPRNISVQV